MVIDTVVSDIKKRISNLMNPVLEIRYVKFGKPNVLHVGEIDVEEELKRLSELEKNGVRQVSYALLGLKAYWVINLEQGAGYRAQLVTARTEHDEIKVLIRENVEESVQLQYLNIEARS